MKIKNIYLLIIINILLLSSSYNLKASSTPKTPHGMPMISEEELKKMMQNAVEEYQRLPEAEKELMSQQLQIKREELDEIMNEAAAFVEEINANENKKSTFDQKEESSFNAIESTPANKNAAPSSRNSELKNETKELIIIFDKAIRTLQTLILKSSDQGIREKIIADFDTALSSIEKLIYYFSLIKQFLSNNENQSLINSTDINKLLTIANKINTLKDSIEKLITLNEYENTNNKNNLFEKYSIKKNSNTELKKFLENEITSLQNKIKEIETEVSEDNKNKKEKSKKIINLEYKIDILETDLTQLETNILENKKQNTQFNEYQKLLNESLDKIIKNLKNILITDNAIIQIEEIIRKYFPEEYKIGKQKEEHIKKQITTEKKIKEQKGPSSDLHTERNIKMSSERDSKNNKDENSNNNFQASNSQNDDYEDNNNQEESPFDFPKKEEISGKNGNDKKEKQPTESNAKEADSNSHSDSSDKKKYRDLRHKDTKETDKDQKKITAKDKKDKNDITIIQEKLKNINTLINEFIENNPENKYSQTHTTLFTTALEKQLKELKETFTNISNAFVKSHGDKNPFINQQVLSTKEKEEGKTQEPFISINSKNNFYINTELEKIDLLKIKLSQDPLPQAQLTLYQLEEIQEKLNKEFNDKTRVKEYYSYLKPIFSLFDELYSEYKKSCIKALDTKNIPYWLLTKEEIEKQIAEKENNTRKSVS